MELSLLDAPLTGIDYAQLHATGEPVTCAPSQAATPAGGLMMVADTTSGPWGPAQMPKELWGAESG